MNYKPGEVIGIHNDHDVIYYDGFIKRKVDLELLRMFIGDQAKGIVGHCIRILKDRSGRINAVQVID